MNVVSKARNQQRAVHAILSPRVAALSAGLPNFKSTLTESDLIRSVETRSYNVCFVSANEVESLSQTLRRTDPGILIVLVSGRSPAAPVPASAIDIVLPAEFPREGITNLLAPFIERKLAEQQDQSLVSRAAESLRGRLEWLGYKEARRNLDHTSESKSIIENLRVSLSQGAGFGTILTLIDMIGDWNQCSPSCQLDPEIKGMLLQNSQIARHHLEALTKIIELMSAPFSRSEHSIAETAESLRGAAGVIKPFLDSKGMTMRFAEPPGELRDVTVDLPHLQTAFQELIINAYKYGDAGSSIDVLWSLTHGFLTVAVKNNTPEDDSYITEKLDGLTSPFLRLHPPVEDIISIETFGLGLGLTMVEHIMVRNKGLFALSRVSDHTGTSPSPCTLAQLFIPLSETNSQQRNFQ